MMPASSPTRPSAQSQSHSLPPLDEAASVPFSALFDNNHFDLATVEATAQLADRSIFVMPNGRRFLFESIPDPQYPKASQPSLPSAEPQPPAQQYPSQYQYQQQQQQQQQHAPRRSPPVASFNPAQDLEALRRNSTTIRRRPVSNTSSQLYSPGGGRQVSNLSGQAPATEPNVSTHEVTAMMSNMDIRHSTRFGAAPLFGHSDGGVQAAEALTESYPGPRDEPSPGSPYSSTSLPAHPPMQQYATPTTQPAYPDTTNATHMNGCGGQIQNFNYPNYMAQAHQAQQLAQQQAPASPSRPQFESLMDQSSPVSSLQVTTEQYYASWGGVSPYSPQREASEIQMVANGGGSPSRVGTEYSPRPVASSPASERAASLTYQPARPDYVNAGRSYPYAPNGFDTQTPVIVVESQEEQQQQQRQLRQLSSASTTDSRSTGRDNIMPGEDMLFDGPVKSSAALTSPVFLDGQLKVFRNTITNDLRFHCKVGNDSETYWMKSTNAQLVPVYAYDPRFPNVVFIRDKNENASNNALSYAQSPTGTAQGRPSGIYQFGRLKELCDFQAKLTAEKVVLDIASVKLVRLTKASSRNSETYSSIRLQIWHEAELRKERQSDVASFVTAGTALSGPLRERLVASSSRLMIYLGRLGEYINVFITDDVEVKADGPTMVKLKPRKAGGIGKKGSRWPGIKAHIESKQQFEMAGLDIHGQAPNVDVESRYDLYKTFDIDFENSPSQDNFIRKWDEVMKERRSQRMRLNQIQEEMEQNVFSGRKARELW
ncbi:hypothetical protein B0H66DRAFT_209329 [Apodospora peruviana]|uniref:Uncharacterized protein n=1 Tax=Apodospora peruviana TaxID=516989 RepID=A0AAE0M7Q8_9PEZI|nr:hypothetical protein B0H66DRAFT_209329 [Apodospora peruviana]